MMEQAIKKAIEGGFNPTFGDELMYKKYDDVSRILLDPLFWQCLIRKEYFDTDTYSDNDEVRIKARARSLCHDFVDHIMDSKSADSFFNQILKQSI